MVIRFFWSAIVLHAIALCAWEAAASDRPVAATAARRLAIPGEEEQRDKLELIREVYAAQTAAAKTPAQKAELAKALLGVAAETSNDPVGRYLLIRMARDAAAEAASLPIILQAIDTMASEYEVERDQLLLGALAGLTRHVRDPRAAAEVSQSILDWIDGAIQNNEFAYAKKLGELVLPIARKSRDSGLVRRVISRNKELQGLARAYEEVEVALAVLDKEPANADANLTVGRFFCFLKNDWSTGLPMLALSRDGILADVAAKELETIEDAQEQEALGDQWQVAAEQLKGEARIGALSRAELWYEKALPGLKGLAKQNLEHKIETVQKVLSKSSPKNLAGIPPGAVLVMTFDRNSIVKRGGEVFVKDSSGRGTHGAIRGAAPAAGVVGEALAFNGKSSYVDLGNPAQLQITGSQTISMWIWPDDLESRTTPFAKAYGGEGTITLFSDGTLRYVYGVSGKNATPYTYLDSPVTLELNQWAHIAAVRDLKAQTIAWYINGTRTAEGMAKYPTAKPSALRAYIGKGHAKLFAGKIDELMVFNRALSPQEIGALIKRR